VCTVPAHFYLSHQTSFVSCYCSLLHIYLSLSMFSKKMPMNAKKLPTDVFSYRENQWYSLVCDIVGQADTMELLKFLHFSSPLLFLACPNPLEFLNHDADALLPIKQKLCIKLTGSSYVPLPGIQTALDLLRGCFRSVMKKITRKRKRLTRSLKTPLPFLL